MKKKSTIVIIEEDNQSHIFPFLSRRILMRSALGSKI